MTEQSEGSEARSPWSRERLQNRFGHAMAFGVNTARRYRWFLLSAALYLIPVLIAFRLEVFASPGQLPQGTNALNAFLYYHQWKVYPLETWYNPFTDWGLAVDGYTGPSLLYLGTLTLDPTTLVRVIEFVSFWLSGITAYLLLRNLGAHPLGAFAAGFYYMLMAQSPQFFEGHVPFLISLAIAPVYLLAVYRFGATFRLGWGLIFAVSLYLLASIGDLGALYFLLFFSLPLLAYSVARHGEHRKLTWTHAWAIGLSVAVFVVLMATWWVPYALGARPQYTTNITVLVPAFSGLIGEPFGFAYTGASFENSFTSFALGQPTLALDNSLLSPLYYVIPVAITLYVVLKRTLGRALLYLAGLVAIIISTGPAYPGFSSFNLLLYTYVPFFDYIPNFPSWLSITVIVYTIFVGWLVSDLAKWTTQTAGASKQSAEAGLDFAVSVKWTDSDGMVHRYRAGPRWDLQRVLGMTRRRPRAVVLAVCVVFIVVTVGLQNSELISTPPQLFEFPHGYISGYEYIDSQPQRGGTLTIPFGTLYERSPWGGVSVSSEVMAAYYTNSNSVVFEAGTPYSLAMDWLIEHDLQQGYSDNITKYLGGTNVQFVTATNYTDWAYASSSLGAPEIQYSNLYRQVGLASPVYTGGQQTVYDIGTPEGNLSFHRSYYIYFAGESLINELLNQPFYNGSQVLLNGSQLDPSSLPDFVEHSSGLVLAPASMTSVPQSVLTAAEDAHVPILSISGAQDLVPGTGNTVSDPWNASNALTVQPRSTGAPAEYAFNQTSLLEAGATNVAGAIRASCPPGALIGLGNGGSEYSAAYEAPGASFSPLSINSSSLVSAGINNQGKYAYNGSVQVSYPNGSPEFSWSLSPSNDTYQYLNFWLNNLTGDDGLTFTLSNEPGLPTEFLMQLLFNNTQVSIPGYLSAGAGGTTGVSYSFLFSDAFGPGVATLAQNLGKITRFVFGPLQTGSASHFNVTNVSFLKGVTGTPFQLVPLPSIPLVSGTTVSLTATSLCKVDTLAFQTGAVVSPANTLSSYLGLQSDPLSLTAVSDDHGWGLLLASETFSPLWQLVINGAPTGVHAVANLGLNAWLVNLSSGEQLTVRYLGQEYQSIGIVIEVVGLPLLVLAVLFPRLRRPQGKNSVISGWFRRSPGSTGK